MQTRPRIYVFLTNTDYDRCVLDGISQYLSEHAPEMEVVMEMHYPGNDMLHAGKGIIIRVSKPGDAASFHNCSLPLVNISGIYEFDDLPSAIMDNALAGRLVAEHLLVRRFHHFAYYGQISSRSAVVLSRTFEQTIHEAGFQCTTYFQTWDRLDYAVPPDQQQDLRQWVAGLPKPIGIFCGSDHYAWELSKACEALELKVGKDIGIVGSGNEEFYCMSRHPNLSSVKNSPLRIGHEAAALLLRLINGEPPPAEPILIPPTIVMRASSDAFVTDDPHVTMAIKFIREHIHQSLSIQSVMDHVPLSRDSLERRFRKHLDYTIMETIHLLKIDHIKYLLASTSKTMEEIASATGLSGGPHLTILFREKTGTTPSEYRHRFQEGTTSKS